MTNIAIATGRQCDVTHSADVFAASHTSERTCHVKRTECALGGKIPQPNPVFSIFVAFKGIWFGDQRTNARSEQVNEGEANPSQEVRCS